MKRILLTLLVCFVNIQARKEGRLIRYVYQLANQSPSKDAFIESVTVVPRNKKTNLIGISKDLSPRLHATLLRGKTSLGFTDKALKNKLRTLVLEQDLLDGLEAKNLFAVFEAIAKGADVNTVTEQGHTALMLAVLKADQEAVKDLLKRGAKQSVKAEVIFDDSVDVQHMNALELAQKLNYQPIVKILKKAL